MANREIERSQGYPASGSDATVTGRDVMGREQAQHGGAGAVEIHRCCSLGRLIDCVAMINNEPQSLYQALEQQRQIFKVANDLDDQLFRMLSRRIDSLNTSLNRAYFEIGTCKAEIERLKRLVEKRG